MLLIPMSNIITHVLHSPQVLEAFIITPTKQDHEAYHAKYQDIVRYHKQTAGLIQQRNRNQCHQPLIKRSSR